MILDDGICTVFAKSNIAPKGHKPIFDFSWKHGGWYKQISFSTTPRNSEVRESTTIARRIRILQNQDITNHDVVVLDDVMEVPNEGTVYEVVRAFHGLDDDTGEPISDLYLEVMKP